MGGKTGGGQCWAHASLSKEDKVREGNNLGVLYLENNYENGPFH